MVTKSHFPKNLPRFTGFVTLFLSALVLLSGCDDKLGKLKGKWDVIERILKSAQAESDHLQEKIAKLREWEKEDPPPRNAIQKLTTEIDSEQKLLNGKRDQVLAQLPELTKEIKELDDTELVQVLEYIRKWIPLLESWLGVKMGKLKEADSKVSAGVEEKLNNVSAVVDQEIAMIQQLAELGPGPEKGVLLTELAGLIADASAISLHEELKLVGEMAELFAHIGPLPVVAGSLIEEISFVIEEGLPEGFEHLDNGLLEAGSELILQLPGGWVLTAPADIASDNLDLEVTGNEPGSGIIKMLLVSEGVPGTPNDAINITFNGIMVCDKTGLATATLSVIPGRTSKQDFCVLPEQQVRSIGKSDNAVTLSWDSFGSRLYTVQWASDLLDGTWVDIPGGPTTDRSWAGEDTTGVSERYYRVTAP